MSGEGAAASGPAPRVALAHGPRGFVRDGEPGAALGALAAAAMRADRLDPLITEVVRLRCAQVHDCRHCASLRLQDAAEAGFDEPMAAAVLRYEDSDLGPAAGAALRLADAITLTPGRVDDDLRGELAAHFTDEQIAEICLDVVKWSRQKVLVALRLEEPLPDGPTALSFDADGAPLIT